MAIQNPQRAEDRRSFSTVEFPASHVWPEAFCQRPSPWVGRKLVSILDKEGVQLAPSCATWWHGEWEIKDLTYSSCSNPPKSRTVIDTYSWLCLIIFVYLICVWVYIVFFYLFGVTIDHEHGLKWWSSVEKQSLRKRWASVARRQPLWISQGCYCHLGLGIIALINIGILVI